MRTTCEFTTCFPPGILSGRRYDLPYIDGTGNDSIKIDEETVVKYKRNYGIPEEASVTPAMIGHHWRLERTLTDQLLSSTPENRWTVWESSYSQLYSECSWLNRLAVTQPQSEQLRYGHFLALIKDAEKIYEVGSGEGGLINFLAKHGYNCVATEVTRERSFERDTRENLEWHTTDGVNLSQLEPLEYYDIVLSTQVIEHLHPDDLATHFSEASKILKPGGKYILTTPHCFLGPADLSRIFEKQRAMCMHLKEYSYSELQQVLQHSGFNEIYAVFLPPNRIRKYIPLFIKSRAYLSYMTFHETILERLAERTGWRLPKLLLRMLLFTGDIFIVASK